jgi:hypothetical protein
MEDSLKARELKNIELVYEQDKFVHFIMITISKNHAYKENKFNQVRTISAPDDEYSQF